MFVVEEALSCRIGESTDWQKSLSLWDLYALLISALEYKEHVFRFLECIGY